MRKYVKTPTVYQMEAAECGAASLAMVFSFFGKHFSMEQLRAETGVSRDGCNAGNLFRVAEKYGLECHGYKKKAESLSKLKPPCILYWEFNHFVVFEGFRGGYVYINDPAYGRRRLTKKELKQGYAGAVLTFKKTTSFRKTERRGSLYGIVKNRIADQWDMMLRVFGVSLLMMFPGVLSVVLVQQFIDRVMIQGQTEVHAYILGAMAVVLLVYLILMGYRDCMQEKLEKRAMLFSLRGLLDKLLRLPISFFEQRYPGDLSVRIENHSKVNRYLMKDFMENVQMILHSVFYLILIFIYHPVLGGTVLCSACLSVAVLKGYEAVASNVAVLVQQETGKLAGMIGAGVRMKMTLKVSGAETAYLKKLKEQQKRKDKREQSLHFCRNVADVMTELIKWVTIAVLFAVGNRQIVQGNLSLGMLAAVVLLYLAFDKPVQMVARKLDHIQRAKAEIMREEDIYRHPFDDTLNKQNRKKNITEKLDGAIELRNVSFRYSNLQKPVLKHISFRMECGLRYALVGPSGAGKSTLLNVMNGLYLPEEGTVFLDGTDRNRIPKEVRTASVSNVSSNGVFFDGSIRENLTMWNPNISESDLVWAAKDACIHDEIVNKPGAYEYRLTEDASNLSGGQRQRLEIARALATNPSILILDEATSALDPMVEKRIMDNIKRRGCTCIIAAQRLSAVRDCDRILVLKGGNLVQDGTHEELMLQEGIYRTLVNSK